MLFTNSGLGQRHDLRKRLSIHHKLLFDCSSLPTADLLKIRTLALEAFDLCVHLLLVCLLGRL